MDTLSPYADNGNIPEKQCTGPCGRTLPAAIEYFSPRKSGKYGFASECKSCSSARSKAYAEAHKEEVSERKKASYRKPGNQERKSDYNKAYRSDPERHERLIEKDKAYRSRPEIQEQRQAKDKARYYRPEVHEHILIGKKTYYQLRREDILAQKKVYQSNPEVQQHRHTYNKGYRSRPEIASRLRAQSIERRNRPGNKERRRAWMAQYRPIYFDRPGVRERSRIQWRAYTHARRSRKRSIAGSYTPQQIQEQLKRQRYHCYYEACGHAKFEKRNGKYIYHIDHTFPLSRVIGTDIPANDISYLVLTCPSCNVRKSNKFPWEWPEGGRLL